MHVIEWREDCYQCVLEFSSCQFSEDQRPFKFSSNGILGILYAVVIFVLF